MKFGDPQFYPVAQAQALDPSLHSAFMEFYVRDQRYVVLSLMKIGKGKTKEGSTLARFQFVEDDKYEFEVRPSLSCCFAGCNGCRSTYSDSLVVSNYGSSPYREM